MTVAHVGAGCEHGDLIIEYIIHEFWDKKSIFLLWMEQGGGTRRKANGENRIKIN